MNHEGVGTALPHSGKGGLKDLRRPRLHALELHVERLGFPRDVGRHAGMRRHRWVDQDRDPGERRHGFFEELELFPHELDDRGAPAR